MWKISRQLVGGQIDLETAFNSNTAFCKLNPFPTKLQVTLAATFSAPFFSVMFSGNIYDALGAGVATLFGFAFSPSMWKNLSEFPLWQPLLAFVSLI